VLFAIGGQTPRAIGLKIGRNSHRDNAMKIGGSAIASAHLGARCARKSGQTAGPIGAHIGTNTYWDNGQKLWGSAIASAH
jgi:hypothetical protein